MNKKRSLLIAIVLIILVIIGLAIYFVTRMRVSTFPVVHQATGQIIQGFPDFPSYPNATVTSTQIDEAKGDQPLSYQAYLASGKGVQEIIDWYSQSLQSSGWTVTRPADPTNADDQNVMVVKNNLTATVNVEKEGDSETTISVFIIQK